MARNSGAERNNVGVSAATERGLEPILQKIRASRNFDFRNYKRGTLLRRIRRRMQECGKRTMRDYASLLGRDPAELDALMSAILIKVTSFFRDPELWDELSTKVIPRMLSEKPSGEEIRVWCPGCATGEEAFTAAMVLAEAMGASFANQEIRVFGTDVDDAAIAYARRGHYTRQQVESVPKRLLAEWFVQEGDGYSVRKELRRSVVFGINNLVSDAPISRLDLLICRNVFIYLDAMLQKRVLNRFHYALRKHGILVLGKAELIPFAARIFEPIDSARRIYRNDGDKDMALAHERLMGLLEQESSDYDAGQRPKDEGSIDQFHRDVLQSLPRPVVATSLDGDVMLWNRAASELWNRPDRETVGKKLSALNLAGLSGELLIEKTASVREGRSESESGDGIVRRGNDSRGTHISVEVSPLRDAAGASTGLLYVVSDVTAYCDPELELRKATEERQSAFEELQTINEEMQSSNEELETTNEELQSANEELQTTNEELQSTNEELETTNEELQSTNAELDATNRELAHRTDEMNTLTFLQRAIIRSLSAAIIVVDDSGRVTLWNLAAERLLGLTEAEAVGQVLWTVHVSALSRSSLAKVRKALSQNVAARNEEVPYELPGGAPAKALLTAVPIVDGGRPLGAVLILEDVTRLSNLVAENARLKDGGRASQDA